MVRRRARFPDERQGLRFDGCPELSRWSVDGHLVATVTEATHAERRSPSWRSWWTTRKASRKGFSMRFATYVSPTDGVEHVGVVHAGSIYGLAEPVRLLDLLGDEGERLIAAGERAVAQPFEVVVETDATLRAPVPVPPSVRDFMAFEAHVLNSMEAIGQHVDPDWYELPVFYFQNPAAIRGPRDDIPISPGSNKFDYELEVAAVVGRAGSDLAPEQAARFLAGYTVMCDWSARDVQAREMRQSLGAVKSKDSATSLGPYLVTADELETSAAGNGFNLRMVASVNGAVYSEGNLADLYWSFGEMLAYASRGTSIMPGDIVASGTVGTGCILELSRVHGEDRYPYLQPGDSVRLEVERLGAIETTILPAREVVPLR
jgi:2-keto-4-pentenoate hydratase/2-oxohepta-3-ene-1,7-dioic acid hydratase in catechol pathway